MKEAIVSIITICYNDKEGLERTILSVINQNYSNYEFIVIDGGSNDGSKEIIEHYKSKLDFFVSEKDFGIYDAMNKGILASKGKWLNFMNSGDTFYNDNVLNEVFSDEDGFDKKAVIYGYKIQNGQKVFPLSIDSLESGIIMANHQSMFFNKEICNKDIYYNLKYSVYADYDLVNRIYLKFGKEYFQYISKPIAIYEGGGVSSNVSLQKRKDKFLIMVKYYGFFKALFIMSFGKLKKIFFV